MARSDLIEARVAKLISGFGAYVQTYDDRVPFIREQLTSHRQTIDLRRRTGSLRATVESEQFVRSLRQTLLAWESGAGRPAWCQPTSSPPLFTPHSPVSNHSKSW